MGNFVDKHEKIIVELSNWYQNNKRKLPWRETKDPYKIWLSEIILQQTRVAQGLSYYLKFVEHYPTVSDLANSSEEKILKDWQGLGYYSRARNLHKAAKHIFHELGGVFPNNYNDIKKLSGIGDYTAAAIASFAFDLPHAVVDGNVYRVLSRLFNIETPIDSSKGKKEFQQIADQLLNKEDPASHNQGIMEFGATQCLPKNPDCNICPLQNSCYAYRINNVSNLPKKKNKVKQKTIFLNYLIIESGNKIAVNHRNTKGIWQNMYDFPLIQSKKEINVSSLMRTEHFKKIDPQTKLSFQAESTLRKHILSHQILLSKFYHFRINDFSLLNGNYEIILKEKLVELPIPKLIENYLNEETNLLSLFNP